ncbi:methyl-accepting chemotaxis protein [Pseudoxanthomonas daejeonensis]|nr:methyl-accepting chemotaxis protein [Pseudoxanthomonas daejeonensis]UNK57615.1 methyl-accepting chemotaxis protein [Pseudoxanthomonas daejeonensis]
MSSTHGSKKKLPLPNLRIAPLVASASRRLRYLSIRSKILLLPAIALAGLLGYFVYSAAVLRANTGTLEGFAERTLPVMTLSAQANQGLIETQGLFTQALGDRDEFLIEDANKQASITRERLLEIKATDAAYAKRVDALAALWDRYVERSGTAVTGMIAGNGDMEAFQALAAEKQAAFEQVRNELARLAKDSEASSQAAIAGATARSRSALKVGLGIVVVLSLLALVTVLLVDAAIRHPIERLDQAIAEVARGNFSVRVEAEGRDAISAMCHSFNALLVALNAAIAESNDVLAAVGRGEFGRRVDADLPGDLARLKSGVNASADSVQKTMDALDAVMDAMARGDFSARMSNEVQGESRGKVDRAMGLLQQSLAALEHSLSGAAEGDFSRRIDTELPGELDQLKRAVNRSLSALEAAFDEIGATTQALAEGDLTRRIRSDYAGTLKTLTDSLNSALDSVSQVILEGMYNAEEVGVGVEEIARGNADLSGRTERQANALQDSAASIEQLLVAARNAADNSRQTSGLTHGALDNSRQGVDVAAQASSSMVSITEASRRIGEIISLIDSVAFQTNILALNAAVEAARAGEHGRGFAVVATEVRSLAHRTGTSAKEIRDLIADAISRVGEGSGLVDESRRQLQAIAESNETIAGLAQQAADSAQEQSQGLQQLSRSVGDLESVNQQNSALVEEVAAASASLRERAQALRAAMGRFRVQPGSAGDAHDPYFAQAS